MLLHEEQVEREEAALVERCAWDVGAAVLAWVVVDVGSGAVVVVASVAAAGVGVAAGLAGRSGAALGERCAWDVVVAVFAWVGVDVGSGTVAAASSARVGVVSGAVPEVAAGFGGLGAGESARGKSVAAVEPSHLYRRNAATNGKEQWGREEKARRGAPGSGVAELRPAFPACCLLA